MLTLGVEITKAPLSSEGSSLQEVCAGGLRCWVWDLGLSRVLIPDIEIFPTVKVSSAAVCARIRACCSASGAGLVFPKGSRT